MTAQIAAEDGRSDAWFAERLALLDQANTDRALTPSARHALVELLFDEIEEPDDTADRHLGCSGRLAGRLRLTTRGARKALAELAEAGVVEQTRGDVRVAPAAVAERLCRGTDLPQDEAADHANPIGAHADRLERLRDRALDIGLVSTALAAERALGRALGFYARKARRFDYVPPDYSAMPPRERKGVYFNMVIPMLRDFFLLDPDHQDTLLAFFADFRKASAAALGEAAASSFETRVSRAPQDEASDFEVRVGPPCSRPHPEERGARLEGRGRPQSDAELPVRT